MSLSRRIQKQRAQDARLEHKAALRKQEARLKRESTQEHISRLRADIAR